MSQTDRTGQVFGLLTVLHRLENGKWFCQCQCGQTCEVRNGNLQQGRTRSCGCLRKTAASRRVKDLSGKRFGRLLVQSRSNSSGKARWFCRCDCGKIVDVQATHLIQGATVSCGCYHRDAVTKHGGTGTKEYTAWENIRARAGNPDDSWYSGVTMDSEWRNDFTAFLRDVGKAPGPEYSVDRIDPHKGYEPGNCRWATADVQSRNRRWRNGKCPGVRRSTNGKRWTVEIRAGKTYRYLGTFDKYEQAVQARLAAEVELWGEAYIN